MALLKPSNDVIKNFKHVIFITNIVILAFRLLKLYQFDHSGITQLPKYLFTHAPRMQFHIDFIYFHNFANDHHPLLCSRGRMSFLGKIFGGKGGQDKPVTTGEAIQKLRETEDMLMKKQVLKFIGGKV